LGGFDFGAANGKAYMSEVNPSSKGDGGTGDEHSTLRTDAALFAGNRAWLRSGFDLLIEDERQSRRMPMCYSYLTVGRDLADRRCDITVEAEGICGRQAMLKLVKGQVFFTNLDVRVTCKVNGEESAFAQLRDGDVLELGSARITLIQLKEAVAFLEGYSEPHRQQHWTLSPGANRIGRSGRRSNEVILDDPTVSRAHAVIESQDGVFILRVEGGSEATWVNAEPVEALKVLHDEDLIQLGQQLLRFRTYHLGTRKPRALAPREATILFSDIWNYTQMAEDRPLEQVISQLNEMYRGLGKVIMENQGTLMSYLGDAMMAFFDSDGPADLLHPGRAVRAALNMVRQINQLNREWQVLGKPTLTIGIGIATGEVMVGDVGLTAHREFAAMGDTTNVAARIEKLTRDFQAQVLVSGATARHLGDEFELRDLGATEVRGRRSPVELYEVIGIRQEQL
jgi:class 3 adenylate cyclase